MHPCPPTIVCSGPGVRGKVEGSGINGQFDFLGDSNFKGLKKNLPGNRNVFLLMLSFRLSVLHMNPVK